MSDYDEASLKLSYAHRDAEEFVKTMQQHAKGLYREVIANVITNKDATQRGINKGLKWFHDEMTQRDVGIIFYSGHGDKYQDSLYWLPSDVETDDIFSTGVSEGKIKELLRGVPGKKLMVLDCCHAGKIGEKDVNKKGDQALTDDLVRDLVNDEYGMIMMCSSTGRELSAESHRHQHGYFTVALKEGLSGRPGDGSKLNGSDQNNDGSVYWNELDIYVSNRVKELSNGQQHPVSAHPSLRDFPLTKLP